MKELMEWIAKEAERSKVYTGSPYDQQDWTDGYDSGYRCAMDEVLARLEALPHD